MSGAPSSAVLEEFVRRTVLCQGLKLYSPEYLCAQLMLHARIVGMHVAQCNNYTPYQAFVYARTFYQAAIHSLSALLPCTKLVYAPLRHADTPPAPYRMTNLGKPPSASSLFDIRAFRTDMPFSFNPS